MRIVTCVVGWSIGHRDLEIAFTADGTVVLGAISRSRSPVVVVGAISNLPARFVTLKIMFSPATATVPVVGIPNSHLYHRHRPEQTSPDFSAISGLPMVH
jgi:hypothetical protein